MACGDLRLGGVCQSREAAIIVKPAAVKMALILLSACAFAWYTFNMITWRHVWLFTVLLNPLVIGTLAYTPRFFRRIYSELGQL